MNSVAERVAERFGNDGTVWYDVKGFTLEEACHQIGGTVETDCGEQWRFIFDDGSVLTGNPDGWGIEGSAPYVMRGIE